MPSNASLGPPPPYDLTDRDTVRAIEDERHLRARKNFSQHWLVDRDALDLMVSTAQLTRADNALEVGAGMGVLTAELARRAGRVVAIEIEQGVLPVLRRTIKRYDNVEVLEMDLLKCNPADIFGAEPYKIVANLPYAITALTLRHFLEASNPPTTMIILIQLEVAERITTGAGDMSLLALSTQFYSTPRIIARVPASSFMPRPKVDSAIVQLDIHAPPVTGELRDRIFVIAKAAFAQRRKQLHNVLPGGLHLPASQVQDWLEAAHIAPDRRPQTLSIPEWITLATLMPSMGKSAEAVSSAWSVQEEID